MRRENHYCRETGESQYWEYNSLSGWVRLPGDKGWQFPDHWGRDDYFYHCWPREIPPAIKGQPPRIWI